MPSEPRAERARVRLGRLRFCGLAAAGALFLSVVCAEPLPRAGHAEQRVEESELKAVYLYNFLQFVQWPEPRRGEPADELVIGIVGDTPVRQSLEALQASVSKGGKRPIRIADFGPWREGLDLASCHLIFLAPSERQRFGAILAELAGLPVLTVADVEDFLDAGGMIALTESRGKLRWMINRRPADEAGLRFSAQMLRLAIRVLE